MSLEFEYGKAVGRLEEFRRNHQNHPCVQNLTMRHFWRTAQVCCDQKTITNRHAELIRDAWRKRAMCRRTCADCETYQNNLKDSYGIIWCDYINAYTQGNDQCAGCPFFEPRKEGK